MAQRGLDTAPIARPFTPLPPLAMREAAGRDHLAHARAERHLAFAAEQGDATRAFAHGKPVNQGAVDRDLARARPDESGDRPKQRRLSRPVWPDDRNKLSGRDLEADVFEEHARTGGDARARKRYVPHMRVAEAGRRYR